MIRRLLRLTRERRGVGAVEFAVAAPFLILLYVGGYQLMDAISAYRKVTTATRTMADLTTRQKEVTSDKLIAIMEASRQVMAPYSTKDATLRISQIRFDKDRKPSVVWSVSINGGKLKNGDIDQSNDRCGEAEPPQKPKPGKPAPEPKGGKGKGNDNKIDIPCEISVPDTFVIYSELTYPYNPVVGDGIIGPISFGDQLFMNPRLSNEIKCDKDKPKDDDEEGEGKKGPRKC